MKKLEISLVICVADDIRIMNMLESIDVFCEVVVVLNGATIQVKKIIQKYKNTEKYKLVVVEISERNLSKSRNMGMKKATYDKVILYDSDCIVVKGAIEKFYNLLDQYMLVDGKVLFKADTFQSKIISPTRELGIPGYALCPAIGIHKKIKEKVGNYFFDDDIQWIEDSELNIRAKKAKIEVGIINEVTCIHDNLTFKQDLKSAYRYGYGVKNAALKNLHKNSPTANWNLIYPISKKSIFSAIYYFCWNIIYCVGYYLHVKI